ncbi:MAG: hypothetical protein L0I76_08670, partial [Pseudonocardia sp.]|nr:hypothetical protein [Pseudonocardia sp.]
MATSSTDGPLVARLRMVRIDTRPPNPNRKCRGRPAMLRRVLETVMDVWMAVRPRAVVSKRRRVLFNVIEYAAEQRALDTNPLVGARRRIDEALGCRA